MNVTELQTRLTRLEELFDKLQDTRPSWENATRMEEVYAEMVEVEELIEDYEAAYPTIISGGEVIELGPQDRDNQELPF